MNPLNRFDFLHEEVFVQGNALVRRLHGILVRPPHAENFAILDEREFPCLSAHPKASPADRDPRRRGVSDWD